MKLRTFYKIYYEHRYKKANHILKLYILLLIPIKYLINLIYLPKIINLDNFVDRFGNIVDADGEYVVDAEPFLDDEGNPVIVEEEPAVQAEKKAENAEKVESAEKAEDTDSSKKEEPKPEETSESA